MRNFLFDVRLVLRQLRKSPGFAMTAVLMMAFGIGAPTAIFSIIDCVFVASDAFSEPRTTRDSR